VSVILKGGFNRDVPMHTIEDALAVGHWLKAQRNRQDLWIEDAEGNIIMDTDLYRERVGQYGEKV
jgi:hypothetical protein